MKNILIIVWKSPSYQAYINVLLLKKLFIIYYNVIKLQNCYGKKNINISVVVLKFLFAANIIDKCFCTWSCHLVSELFMTLGIVKKKNLVILIYQMKEKLLTQSQTTLNNIEMVTRMSSRLVRDKIVEIFC